MCTYTVDSSTEIWLVVLPMPLARKQLRNQMNNTVGLAAEGHLTSSHVVLPTTIVGSLEFLTY
jgi:hypothetical protein